MDNRYPVLKKIFSICFFILFGIGIITTTYLNIHYKTFLDVENIIFMGVTSSYFLLAFLFYFLWQQSISYFTKHKSLMWIPQAFRGISWVFLMFAISYGLYICEMHSDWIYQAGLIIDVLGSIFGILTFFRVTKGLIRK